MLRTNITPTRGISKTNNIDYFIHQSQPTDTEDKGTVHQENYQTQTSKITKI